GPEYRVFFCLRVSLFQFQDQRHQSLGDEAAAIEPEMAALVRASAEGIGLLDGHALLAANIWAAAARAARMKARILSGSFSPGAPSTPEDTWRARARVTRNASATLPASSPPDSMKSSPGSSPSSSRQSKLLPSPPGRVAARGARASNRTRSAIPA